MTEGFEGVQRSLFEHAATEALDVDEPASLCPHESTEVVRQQWIGRGGDGWNYYRRCNDCKRRLTDRLDPAAIAAAIYPRSLDELRVVGAMV